MLLVKLWDALKRCGGLEEEGIFRLAPDASKSAVCPESFAPPAHAATKPRALAGARTRAARGSARAPRPSWPKRAPRGAVAHVNATPSRVTPTACASERDTLAKSSVCVIADQEPRDRISK